ncbi:hypothetical protein GCM10027299_13460 [Larkinella ripae]
MKTATETIQPPEIVVKYIGNRKRTSLWELVSSLQVELSDGSLLDIPAGYTTNFASVPRILWNILPPFGISVCIASLVHDYLYDTRKDGRDWKEKQRADKEFRHLLMKYNPEGETANKFMYVGVKLFGRKQFREE